MEFLDLFAGIGGFRMALERAGHECVGFCEIDKYARQTYKANFNTEGEAEWHDITTVTTGDIGELGTVDIICGGFPCQSFSVAGKRGGFEDARGTLFFEIARIAKQIQPRYLLLENVKGLLSHDEGNTFGTILNTLDELGYDCSWQVLNSKNFGVPQNRERVFIVGHSRRFPRREVFPVGDSAQEDIPRAENTGIQIIHDKRQTGETRIYRDICPTVTRFWGAGGGNVPYVRDEPKLVGGIGEKNFGKQYRQGNRVYDADALAMCLNAQPVGNAGGNSYLYKVGSRIRKLTPLECFRLQGFPDSHHDNAKAVGVSDSQLYKQAGNAVTVNVVYEIARRLT